MDKNILQDQITGLQAAIIVKRRERDTHIRLQGLNTEAEKLRQEALDYSNKAEAEKVKLSALHAQRAQLVQKTSSALMERMKEVLPAGHPDVEVTEDGVFIGWIRPDGTRIAYNGLSGGEKVAFDAALAMALKANVVIIEAAEMDEKRLSGSLEKLGAAPVQAIVSTCYPPKATPNGWKEVRL